MNKFITSTMAALLLSACASMGQMTQLQKVELGCASASTAIKVLAVANREDKLTPIQVAKIREAAEVLAPVCLADSPPTLTSIKEAAFDEAVRVIMKEAAKHER